MTKKTDILEPLQDKEYYLPAAGTWPESSYWLDSKSQDAIELAVACGRPLLVQGAPGTGKSDLARAAAEYLCRAFVYEVVTARTEPQDLLWRFDAIARLADAQAKGAGCVVEENAADPANPLHYVSPGPLWWALNWELAEQHYLEDCKIATQRPDKTLKIRNDKPVEQKQRALNKGSVLLLDEIDKADSELPNSLLEVLANSGFKKPWSGEDEIKPDSAKKSGPKPLIIITTNEDRELPPAFVRRCLVINIQPGEDFAKWIKQRARVHFRDPEKASIANDIRPALSKTVLDEAAKQLMEDRASGSSELTTPGLAEYLDLLRGLHNLAPDDETKQLEWLKRVYQFAFNKGPG